MLLIGHALARLFYFLKTDYVLEHQTNILTPICYFLKKKVNMLTTEIFLSLPRITAMEYGDLDFSLIPTV
jgi:hypothetical protein